MVFAGVVSQTCNYLAAKKQQRQLQKELLRRAAESVMSLACLAEGLLAADVVSFLGTPSELVNLSMTSRSVGQQLALEKHPKWEELFQRRFAVLHESMKHMGAGDWRRVYKLTIEGSCACLVEVFHRQKHQAFALTAQAAWVRWDAKAACYSAKYLSAQPTEAEAIPAAEASRLRFCPLAVRDALRPGKMPTPAERQAPDPVFPYPYRVLPGVDESLEVGGGVEVQFKMQKDSPFGWWYGRLESLNQDAAGNIATATVAFDQFPEDSCWRQMHVEFGDGKLRSNDLGGFVGGIRACNAKEKSHWQSFIALATGKSSKQVA
eukprot:TRINITY_DN18849_c0_g1_i1.p1 TRINITY_DN18849_c0_g1~~TRINITY_DN18849_c0_g1_i1.p1  ORF type:complete len:320 (-),score=89.02 TRINITY_DN18849_c0_g1_i1:539-1498(-)